MMMITSASFAQTTQDDIKSLLNEIRYELDYVADQTTLAKTQRHLQRALTTLQGGNGGPIPPTGPLLKCGSKDDDGRSPYQILSQDPRTLTFTKLKGAIFRTTTECQQAISKSLTVRDSVIVCASKDEDGRSPYSVNHYKDGLLKNKITVFRTIEECFEATSKAQRTNYAISLCGSKDNDGRSPYVHISYILDSGTMSTGSTYRTLNECYNAK